MSALEHGRAALAGAQWEEAKSSFEEALSLDDCPEARDGLAYALWWLGDIGEALRHGERAYTEYVERADARPAARMALFMSTEYAAARGNLAVSQGWEARADRLLAGAGPCAERVLILLRRADRIDDPGLAATHFQEAMEMASSIGDRDLQIYALSAYGRALVCSGSLDPGFAYLDEAMAATMAGELKDHWLAADASCNMLIACDRVHDLPRATQWCQVAEEWARRHHCLPFFAFCRISYGGLLYARGRWPEAEDELVDAARRAQATHPPLCAHAHARLAELRIAQGQLNDAAELLSPWFDHPACALASAALEVARGELDAATYRLEQRLVAVAPDPSQAAPLCEALASVQLGRGDAAAALRSAEALAKCATQLPSPVLRAMSDTIDGAILAWRAAGDAVPRLSRALVTYSELGLPYRAARVQLLLARALGRDQRGAGLSTARAALATCERLGAHPAAEEAAELVRAFSGARPTLRRKIGHESLTPRERQVLALVADGLSNPLIADQLHITAKTAEHHVCSILAKLGVTTRAAAAAWAASDAQMKKKK